MHDSNEMHNDNILEQATQALREYARTAGTGTGSAQRHIGHTQRSAQRAFYRVQNTEP